MIRFIDLRHHSEDLGARFAFWDTVTDCFVSDDMGDQAWVTMDEFVDYRGDRIGRFVALAPEWAKQGPCVGLARAEADAEVALDRLAEMFVDEAELTLIVRLVDDPAYMVFSNDSLGELAFLLGRLGYEGYEQRNARELLRTPTICAAYDPGGHGSLTRVKCTAEAVDGRHCERHQ